MSHLNPVLSRWCSICLAVFLCAASSVARSQEPTRGQKIAELEKQLGELQKKLEELKRSVPASKAPRPIAMADILAWKGIQGAVLAPDGQWFAYRVGAAEGNGELIVRQTKGDKQYQFAAGPGIGGGPTTFSDDSKWLAFTINPPQPAAGMTSPQKAAGNKVGLVNLSNGTKVEFEAIRRFAFSGTAATYLALHKAPTPSDAAPVTTPAKRPAASPPARAGGTDLILHELASGNNLTLGNVAEFAFDKKGQWLALTIDTRDQFGNGVQLRNMVNAALLVLDSGKAVYQSLAWTEKGEGLTVLKGIDDKAHEGKLYSVLGFTHFDSTPPQKIVYDPHADPLFPEGMTISPHRTPAWRKIWEAFSWAFTR
jgi:hypothetical protein